MCKLRKRFSRENIERVERAYARYGFLAIAIPALLPPPMPFKIFVATAGTLEYPRWKFLITVMLARSFRYYLEGILAVFYGRRVLLFLRDNGLVIGSMVAAVAVIGVLIYAIVNRQTGDAGRAASLAKPVKGDAPAPRTQPDGTDVTASEG